MNHTTSKRRGEKGILTPRQSRGNSPDLPEIPRCEVDLSNLYEYVLKAVLLDYICEARFTQPVVRPELPRVESRPSSEFRKSRLSRYDGDSLLPSYLVADLKAKLNNIAMTSLNHDDLVRRLLLRFYGELLDPRFVDEMRRGGSVDILVMKFVSSANKEVVKMGLVSSEEVALVVFRHTETFVDIIMLLVQKDRNSEAIIAKLNEHKQSLKPGAPSLQTRPSFTSQKGVTMKYSEPSFKVSDLDQGYVALLCEFFRVDHGILQSDIQRLRPVINQKTLHKDVNKFLLLLAEDTSHANEFLSKEVYSEWKKNVIRDCNYLTNKYPIPAALRLQSVPELEGNEEYYFLPPQAMILTYYTELVKMCLLHQRSSEPVDTMSAPLLYSKKGGELMLQCSKLWRMASSTRAVSLITAAQQAGIMTDLFCVAAPGDIGPIMLPQTANVFLTCKRIIDDANGDWDDKASWPVEDQNRWVKQLDNVYSMAFHSLRDCLGSVLSKIVKPRFTPYIQFLDDYVESDCLFHKYEESGGVSRWRRRLTKTLLRTSESLYAQHLETLPRDNTVSILHVLEIADSLIKDIKFLQKRYPHPLLDFLNIGRTYAEVVTDLFALDAQKILTHITSNIAARGEFLNYSDALEVYKSMREIRAIHRQVAPKLKFRFDLEKFSYPYLEAWVQESNEKIRDFVSNALANDEFKPMDLEDDEKKYSLSVYDIFTLIRCYLGILQDLQWDNESQLAKIKTSFMKSISSCCIFYANEISEMVMHDLTIEVESQPTTASNGWLAEAKSLVEQKLGAEKIEEETVNFTPRTCIGLNNLGAMISHLTKLEEILEPEAVSATVLSNDPSARHNYSNHVFTMRLVRGESIRSPSDSSNVRPYVTLTDTSARRIIAKTRTLEGETPNWDEEFEVSLPANSMMTVSVTVWEDRFGSHGVCGRALLQLEPRKFKHDGIPQEVYLDLDPQGRILVEIAVESEREDAIFAMGRAHRALKRAEQRIIKLIVARFSKCIKRGFSRQTLKSICGTSGNIKPSEEQLDEAMMPLYDFLNVNLSVLAECLTKNLLLLVMLEAWNVVVDSADELLLPKLTSSMALRSIGLKSKINGSGNSKVGWQSAVTSAVVNVTNTISNLGFGKTLTINEIETVIGWLNFLCFDFFHNNGNGPPILDLKNDKYQSLLLVPVYYDTDVAILVQEVDRLSPAFIDTLREKNNVFVPGQSAPTKLRSRSGSIARSLTIRANATAKARERAAKEARELQSDPLTAQTSAENIILRLLILRNEKSFVGRRLEQRERLAHTLATERLAKAVAEGSVFR